MKQKLNAERQRLEAQQRGRQNWRLWGPYVAQRAWGTVREDYSERGSARSLWIRSLPFHSASAKHSRWSEDGMAEHGLVANLGRRKQVWRRHSTVLAAIGACASPAETDDGGSRTTRKTRPNARPERAADSWMAAQRPKSAEVPDMEVTRGKVETLPARDALVHAAAGRFVSATAEVAPPFRSGRRTLGRLAPKSLCALLATGPNAARLNGSRVHVFWGDGCCVPPSNPLSNCRPPREVLPDKIVYRNRGEDEPVAAAVAYERKLCELFHIAVGAPRTTADELPAQVIAPCAGHLQWLAEADVEANLKALLSTR